jgi:hypothetical protein
MLLEHARVAANAGEFIYKNGFMGTMVKDQQKI